MTTLNPSPYAEHRGHRFNLSGTHRGNRYCLTCEVPVGVPEVSEGEASASVPVASVVAGANVRVLADRMLIRAYRTRAKTGMHLTQPGGRYVGTVKGFNELTGRSCRNWAEVAVVASAMLGEV